MRSKFKTAYNLIFITILASLTLTGLSYGHWKKIITVDGKITTESWCDGQVRLIKEIDGVFYLPKWCCLCTTTIPDDFIRINETDFCPDVPEPIIHITHTGYPKNSHGCEPKIPKTFPQWFELNLTVINDSSDTVSGLKVVDLIHKNMKPEFLDWGVEGGVKGDDWDRISLDHVYNTGNGNAIVTDNNPGGHYSVEWIIDSLDPGEKESLLVWVRTTLLHNPRWIKFHPTSGDFEWEYEEFPFNYYATLSLTFDSVDYETTTDSIHFLVKDNGIEDDEWGILYLWTGDGEPNEFYPEKTRLEYLPYSVEASIDLS